VRTAPGLRRVRARSGCASSPATTFCSSRSWSSLERRANARTSVLRLLLCQDGRLRAGVGGRLHVPEGVRVRRGRASPRCGRPRGRRCVRSRTASRRGRPDLACSR
jgi:hypothetical protein